MPNPQAADNRGSSPGDDQIEDLGLRLYGAEQRQSAIEPLTDTWPNMTVAEAYAVQQVYVRLRRAAGATVVGHKIGATSRAIQDLFDIDTPDYGHLFDDMRCEEDEPIPTAELIAPLIEPEIAFSLAEDVAGPGLSGRDVVDASAGVVACLEVIDSRIDSWRIRLADTVADNGSSARFVVGTEIVPIASHDLIAEAVVLERNGEKVGVGTGADVLGDPAEAAAWLANAMGAFGVTLRAGTIVLSGSMTTAVPARRGDYFCARFTTLGTVSCVFV